MQRRAVKPAFVALLATLALGAPAEAAPRVADGLHDARYCEIIEVKGLPPDAQAVVWNTIKLNKCPAKDWEAFDAAELAEELGDTAVILNGPRHFLMDSVTATTGRVRSFHGMRMRKVATIPLRTADDLTQRLYADRTIERNNTWVWKKGRTVFELVAPGGDTYVMQSYSQIVDPDLKEAGLPKLGKRLDLPPGWRYRTRKLKKELALVAKGTATILQDDLQNTYQLATTTRGNGKRVRRAVDLTGTTRTTGSPGPGILEDDGDVVGEPFGEGTVNLIATLKDGTMTGPFRLLFDDGSVLGTVDTTYTVTGNEIDFVGTGKLLGGTGAYRGITGNDLQVHDHNTVDGQNGTLEVTGFAKY
jgi:hypothetical protein